MVSFDFSESTAQTDASNSANQAKNFLDKMAVVPLTDFDTKTLALFGYFAYSLAFLIFVCCMVRKASKRSALERRLKHK